jgi:Mrp family chromosome partitioning ATPase
LAQEDSSATPADARIISRAIVPQDPSYPKKIPLIVFATLATFLGTSGWIVASELLSGRVMVGKSRMPRAAAQAAGAASAFSRQTAVEPRLDMPSAPSSDALEVDCDAVALTAASLAAEIGGKRMDEGGICIVATGTTRQNLGTGIEIALGRNLAQAAHAIILDLDGHPANFDPLFASWSEEGHPDADLLGLTDLLCGEASFAEVIRRDDASRLHFISAGCHESFDFSDFDLVLEALAQTYDFILLMTPPLDRNTMAKTLSPHADVVLVSAHAVGAETSAQIKSEFFEAGAKDVIVIDVSKPDVSRIDSKPERQDVA